jgi:hypothetical protein
MMEVLFMGTPRALAEEIARERALSADRPGDRPVDRIADAPVDPPAVRTVPRAPWRPRPALLLALSLVFWLALL